MAREALLAELVAELVADADRLLAVARDAQAAYTADSPDCAGSCHQPHA